jgi:hypothetical protein
MGVGDFRQGVGGAASSQCRQLAPGCAASNTCGWGQMCGVPPTHLIAWPAS